MSDAHLADLERLKKVERQRDKCAEALRKSEKVMAESLSATVNLPNTVKSKPPFPWVIDLTDGALCEARAALAEPDKP